MSRYGRIRSAFAAAMKAFLRRRTAVFFTFLFPVIIILIFGVLVQTQPTGGGLFAQSPTYYLPGYLAVVVLFTPLSRVGSEVARHRDGNRFEKLATTPLTRGEWLSAQTAVNVVVIGLTSVLLLVLVGVLTGATIPTDPVAIALTTGAIVFAVAIFCAIGALLGSLADSQDGVIAASNAIALPLLFLSETFVPPSMLPTWFQPALNLSPLTYFSRTVRGVTDPASMDATGSTAIAWVGVDPTVNLGVLVVLTALTFAIGARVLPRTD